MPEEMKQAYDYTRKLRGLVPGPYKIWLANPKLSQAIVPTGAYYQTESTLTKAEIEIATNVINGHWRAACSNHEQEKIAIEQDHLAPEKVAALITG
jgi:4-carboxymuconolactone decarboxylase